ncbi:hypothetical protein ON005_26880 [Klebsiella pneumoniae]|nr:hypothetical protein ON005_26880 [Klebsiella pneumoniae]
MFAGKKSAQIREILISESAWEEMTCLFAPSLVNAEYAVIDPKKLATYALDSTHPTGGHKARVFESALGYNPTNADVLAARIQKGVLSALATILQTNNYGQTMAVDMPILGINGETAVIRTGWMYETDALVPRLTTIYVK